MPKQFLEFNIDLDNFIDNLKTKLTNNDNKIAQLLDIKQKTFANFVKPLELMDEDLDLFFTPLSHINAVNNSEKSQEIYAASLPLITQYSTKLSQNIDIYNAYKEIQQKEKETLNGEQLRVLELNIQNFELSGANLDEKTKSKLQQINIQLSNLSNNFTQNLLDATNSYEYIIEDKKDIEGLNKSDIEDAKFIQDGKTKYRFTLQMPSYIAYMTYGKNQDIREELYKAYTTRAPQNQEIIDEILSLKHEMANLLGFENYAQYSLASKMAKDQNSVLEFLNTLLQNSKAQAKKEFEELQNIANKPLKSFDVSYYSEILKKENYDIDEELYRVYFEQNSVLDGMFEFLNKLFGLSFKKADIKLWDKKSLAYDIYTKNNQLKARVYFDLEARKNKRGGAWMHNWQSHHNDGDKEHLASAFVVCNFPPSKKDSPSLLRHDDVVTLFHEMGHALHHLLSDVNENEVSGVNGVEWDAVEFPSQFLENFAYEPKVLKLFAKHYKTNQTIPDEMIQKLVKSKNFLSAISMLRQLEFSIFDFKLHTKLYQGDDIQNLLDTIREETSFIKPPAYNKFQHGFSHIFGGGYAAGYYSYKWAEVLSADAFMSIVDEGIFGSDLANRYFETILKNGGSKSMKELFVEFMQREAEPKNLLRLNGIK